MKQSLKSAAPDRRAEKPATIAFARLRRGVTKLTACRLGATAVEFGLVAPLFLSMTLGLMEMSRAMWIKATMQFAVEETTRNFIVNNSKTTAQLKTFAENTLTGTGMSLTGITFTATQGTSGSITIMIVTGTYTFEPVVPFIPFPAVTLNAKSSVPLNS
ncbi:MAG: pilus assembly protein [Proteobacteria bacterium]|nr:pilus assembly protein [Pseudomonadota bacterium]